MQLRTAFPEALRLVGSGSLALFLLDLPGEVSAQSAERPNVILVIIDDLNDWVGAFGGNPQGITPKLDRFAELPGTATFRNAHCAAPVCGPSRSAMLSGFVPHRSGIYNNRQNMLRSELVQTHATLPEYFAKHGYHTLSSGKIFHKHTSFLNPAFQDHGHWAFEEWEQESGTSTPQPASLSSRLKGLVGGRPDASDRFRKSLGSEFAFGPTIEGSEETLDFRTVRWAEGRLSELPSGEPFFMAVGIFMPHLAWHVPQEFFDLHPLESIRLPVFLADDLDDISGPGPDGEPQGGPTDDFLWLLENPTGMRLAVQAYLAATSYADAAFGILLDALKASPHADNTIVVVAGDHGWHLGEKLRFRKNTLWAESTRTPMLIRHPQGKEPMAIDHPVNLIDVYPTLVDLAGLPPKAAGSLDGQSMAPLMRSTQAPWPDHTLTTHSNGRDVAVIGKRWHLIARNGRANEFYDMEKDPMQWTNLLGSEDPEVVAAMEHFRAFIPAKMHPGIPEFTAPRRSEADPALRNLRDLKTLQ